MSSIVRLSDVNGKSAVTTLSQKEDYIYNAGIGLRKWRLAKARLDNSETEIINLNFIGDSITEGYAGLSQTVENYTKGFVNKVRTAIHAQYQDLGEGFIPNLYPIGVASANKRWTYTGTWIQSGTYGWVYGTKGIMVTSVQNSTATLTFDGDGIKVMFRTSTTAAAEASMVIDGGAPETFSLYNATAIIKEYTKTGLGAGSHTIVITFSSATGTMNLLGGYEYKGTAGIRVNKMGISGGITRDFVDADFNLQCVIDHWSPKLTVISLGANEFNTSVALNTFRTNYQTIISRALTYGDVMCTSIGGIFQQTTQTIPISSYNTVVKELAIANNCAYLDISKRWGETYTVASSLGYLVDTVHPKIEGHRDIANILTKVLLEQ